MEIKNFSQYQQTPNVALGKSTSGNAAFFNTTDAFKPGTGNEQPVPDLKKAAEQLLKKKPGLSGDNLDLRDLWENGEYGVVYAADSQRVLMGGYNTEAKALDPTTGKVLWKSDVQGSVTVGKDKTLFVSGPKNFITALDPNTGKELWRKDMGTDCGIFKVADDGTLYARDGRQVIALDPNTREITGQCNVVGDPVVADNGMVYGGGPDAYKVTAYDFKTGEQKWEVKTEGMVRCAPALGKDGTVYAGMVVSNSMVALDPDTGKEKWTFKASGGIVTSPVVGPDGTVYLGDCGRPSHLYAVDPDTGKAKWVFEGKDDFRDGIGFLPDGTVTAPTGCIMNAINPEDGSPRWAKKAKSYLFATPVTGTEGRLYFGTNGQGMHCIRDDMLIDFEYAKAKGEGQAPPPEDLHITTGKGFIEIGGVKLKVNK